MKIIEGTPEEIKQYLKEDIKQTKTVVSRPVWTPRALSKDERHWSNNKQEWVWIDDMNPSYILNVIRIKLKENSNDALLEKDDEFKSLIAHLSDKIDKGI